MLCPRGLAADDYGSAVTEDASRFERLFRLFDAYFSGRPSGFDLPLDPAGTDFQKRVWQALVAIPCGEVRSYGHIARMVGSAGAARAVGGACGQNPLPIVVPCHRVIASSGSLGGFSPLAGGIEVKKRLLRIEGVAYGR